MASSPPLLRLEQVSKRYDSPDNPEGVKVLDNISLAVEAGRSVAIVGPSGSGKSTLLQIIGTLDRPSSGQVWLNGQDLNRLGDADLATVRNRQLGFVFQAHFLLPQCTVLENVLVPTLAGVNGAAKEGARGRAEKLLQRVGLAGRAGHYPGQLSGGERQRAAVVRALINEPQLLLADEPTGSLDHASAQSLGQLLVDLNREQGVTLMVVTHARELAARMGRVLELKDGRFAEQQ
jgi:ABC-type lipoprotein export system ATPase subunit